MTWVLDATPESGTVFRSAEADISFMDNPSTSPLKLFVVLALVATLAVGASAPAKAAVAPEVRLLDMVNAIRDNKGLHPFEMNRRLSRRAERNSRVMARTHTLSHSGKIRAGMAENVGVGPTLQAIVDAWMDSAPHRQNLLGTYRQAGVGVAKSGGLFWVTLTLR